MKRTATARNSFFPAQRAFSLLELLVVMTIIGILAGLLFPALAGVNDKAKRTIAKTNGTNIVVGLSHFNTEYGTYPDLGISGADTFVAADNHRLMDILRARESGSTVQNPRKIPFFTYKNGKVSGSRTRNGYDGSGNLMDPWGFQYKVKYDSSYDNRLMAYGEDLDMGAVVWSVGRDGVEVVNYTELPQGDDVVTWR